MEVTAAWAFAKALVRREFVYGQVVNPSDPQLMEGGSTCPICQVPCHSQAPVQSTTCPINSLLLAGLPGTQLRGLSGRFC